MKSSALIAGILTVVAVQAQSASLTCTFPGRWKTFDGVIGGAWGSIQGCLPALKGVALTRSYSSLNRRSPSKAKTPTPPPLGFGSKTIPVTPSPAPAKPAKTCPIPKFTMSKTSTVNYSTYTSCMCGSSTADASCLVRLAAMSVSLSGSKQYQDSLKVAVCSIIKASIPEVSCSGVVC